MASLRLLLRRNKATLLHLGEVRQAVEGEVAALATERANAEHLRRAARDWQRLGERKKARSHRQNP